MSQRVCTLCDKYANEVQFNMLLNVTEQDIAAWTFNIITLKRFQKMCIGCSQNLQSVGKLLLQWREKLSISFQRVILPKCDLKVEFVPPEAAVRHDTQKVVQREVDSPILIDSEGDADNMVDGSVTEILCIEDSNDILETREKDNKKSETATSDTASSRQILLDPTKQESVELSMQNSKNSSIKKAVIGNTKLPRFLCDHCPRTFTSEVRLNTHKKKLKEKSEKSSNPAKPAKSVTCPHCHGQFKSNGLKLHMDSVHGVASDDAGKKEFLCRFCSKMFSLERLMIEHERIHTKEKPYVCNVCGVGYARPGCLKKHASIHTGEKKYKCRFCDQRFRNSSNQTVHERTVHKTVQYPCPNGCRKRFIFPWHLKKHIKQAGCDIHSAE